MIKYILLLVAIVGCASYRVQAPANPVDTGTFEPVENTGRIR